MFSAITIDRVSKQYRLGQRERYRALRDTLADMLRAPVRGVERLLNGSTETERGDDRIWALRDISFDVAPGEVIGIVGRNGAGKSTLLKVLSRITAPTEGHVTISGPVGSLLEVGTGFHPELSGRENVFLNGAILGMRRARDRAASSTRSSRSRRSSGSSTRPSSTTRAACRCGSPLPWPPTSSPRC